MRLILLALLLLTTVFMTGCGAVTGSLDFGFIKIPMIFVFGAIIVYIIYRRNHR